MRYDENVIFDLLKERSPAFFEKMEERKRNQEKEVQTLKSSGSYGEGLPVIKEEAKTSFQSEEANEEQNMKQQK